MSGALCTTDDWGNFACAGINALSAGIGCYQAGGDFGEILLCGGISALLTLGCVGNFKAVELLDNTIAKKALDVTIGFGYELSSGAINEAIIRNNSHGVGRVEKRSAIDVVNSSRNVANSRIINGKPVKISRRISSGPRSYYP